MSAKNSDEPRSWRLEGPLDSGLTTTFHELELFPVTIGRRSGSDIHVSEGSVSGRHARLLLRDGALFVEDLQSTNGTFVNGERIGSVARLDSHDIVQFGAVEFRVVNATRTEFLLDECQTSMLAAAPSNDGAIGLRRLRELIAERLVRTVFQSIVQIEDGRIVGYEGLSRGAHPDLPEAPDRLLRIAERGGLASELSALFRERAIHTLERSRIPSCRLFVNAHPSELRERELVSRILEARTPHARHSLVLEVHESAHLDPAGFRALRDSLAAIDVEIAYDDFGEGRTRVGELGACPPRYIKFARSLIAGLEHASWERRHVLETMVAMARELGCIPLAEGVETEADLDACAELGFLLAQGYYFDRPVSLEALGTPGIEESGEVPRPGRRERTASRELAPAERTES